MTLYLRDHHWLRYAVAIASSALIAGLLGGVSLRIGYSLSFQLPLSLVAPVLVAVLSVHSLVGRSPHLTALSTRAIRMLVLVRFLGLILIAVISYLAAVAVWPLPDSSIVPLTARNLALLLAMSLIAFHMPNWGWWWAVPVTYVLLCMVAGVSAENSVESWALLLDRQSAPPVTTLAYGGFVCAVALMIVCARGVNRRQYS